MSVLRALFAVALVVIVMAPAQALIQSPRATLSVDLVVTVGPSGTPPVGWLPGEPLPSGPRYDIAYEGPLAALGPLAAAATPILVAANQGAVNVQGTVVANPNANILKINCKPAYTPCNSYNITAPAGAATTYTCPIQITVAPLTASPAWTGTWTLDDGLAQDFPSSAGFIPDSTNPIGASKTAFWNAYPSSGSPALPETFTAYTIYPDNNNSWQVTTSRPTGNVILCVDVNLNIPAGVTLGTYTVTAVYTLAW